MEVDRRLVRTLFIMVRLMIGLYLMVLKLPMWVSFRLFMMLFWMVKVRKVIYRVKLLTLLYVRLVVRFLRLINVRWMVVELGRVRGYRLCLLLI